MLIACNFQFLTVRGTVQLSFDGIHKSTTEKWSEIKSEVDTERGRIVSCRTTYEIERMTMNVDRKVIDGDKNIPKDQLTIYHRLIRNQYES